ncbi:MAG TPA: carotenoid oxygenase family protein [Steroidobacteraceae bacterium]|nr:carotenoid oxygenase family protein [Steroidobacteraceae bacterium]
MSDQPITGPSADESATDRRSFLGGVITAGAGVLAAAAAGAAQPGGPPPGQGSPPSGGRPPAGGPPINDMEQRLAPPARGPQLFRVEQDIAYCEVEGKVPTDLAGGFYRTGPDAQFPLRQGNIPFDGEGHVSLFRFDKGNVHYKSRFVRNERYIAQEKAGRILFPMYRNPYLDDPSVKGKSRGTHNTHIIHHNGVLLALKEDSPPAALDLNTLETLDPVYRFNNTLKSATFTAHPKLDSKTGNLVGFGYEAKGHGTTDVNVFEYTPKGKKVWEAWVKVPYVGMLHDFAVTENFVVLYVIPMRMDQAQMEKGGIHWSWWPGEPTYFGFFRRGGDGKDVQFIKGPERSATHVMGAFDDGRQVAVDVEMSESNPFPFMPMHDGSRWDPVKGTSYITRLSADLTTKTPKDYKMERLYPNITGALPRQDDRYNTAHYRYGFLSCGFSEAENVPGGGRGNGIARFDVQNRTAKIWRAPQGASLAEVCFAPKNANAPEGSGYVMAVATYAAENNRADLVILDAERVENGPVATVKMPTRIAGQVHGWFVPAAAIPKAKA